jgi:hypothetical protein
MRLRKKGHCPFYKLFKAIHLVTARSRKKLTPILDGEFLDKPYAITLPLLGNVIKTTEATGSRKKPAFLPAEVESRLAMLGRNERSLS